MRECENIEKFEGLFENEARGCTIVINETIQTMTNFDLIGLYTFLATMPPNWRINPQHLLKHFKCSKDKIYRLLNELISERLLSVRENRISGRFNQLIYKLHLHRYEPCPENKDTVKSPCPDLPCPENKDTYITNNIYNKDIKNIKTRARENDSNLHKDSSSIKPNPYVESTYDTSYRQEKENEAKNAEEMAMEMIAEDNPHQLSKQSILDLVKKIGGKNITITFWLHMKQELHKCKENGLLVQESFNAFIASSWKSFNADYLIKKFSNKKSGSGRVVYDFKSTEWAKKDIYAL